MSVSAKERKLQKLRGIEERLQCDRAIAQGLASTGGTGVSFARG
jgi:hypothetical protein